MLLGSLGAAAANALALTAHGLGAVSFAVGACLAGVYPPALKATATIR